MIYKHRARWIYQNPEGLKLKFSSEEAALLAEAGDKEDDGTEDTYDWKDESHYLEEEEVGNIA